MPFEQHPTDPDKLIMRAGRYNLQKPWVPLTDEDMQDVIQRAMHSITGGDNTFTLSANKIWVAIVREVEARLKEKNT